MCEKKIKLKQRRGGGGGKVFSIAICCGGKTPKETKKLLKVFIIFTIQREQN